MKNFYSVIQIKDWKDVEINFKNCQVATIKFTQFFEDKNYRLVVMREKSSDPQLDLFTGDNFIYRCILTNDPFFSIFIFIRLFDLSLHCNYSRQSLK